MKICNLMNLAATFTLIIFANGTASAQLVKKEKLYVGIQDGVNAGVVTTDAKYMNGTTEVIGYTVDDVSAQPESGFTEVYRGTVPNVNAGVVTKDMNHKGGSTRSIGYLSKQPIQGGKKLYVGTDPGCNAGVVTPDTGYLNCSTAFVGYALPQ